MRSMISRCAPSLSVEREDALNAKAGELEPGSAHDTQTDSLLTDRQPV